MTDHLNTSGRPYSISINNLNIPSENVVGHSIYAILSVSQPESQLFLTTSKVLCLVIVVNSIIVHVIHLI